MFPNLKCTARRVALWAEVRVLRTGHAALSTWTPFSSPYRKLGN